MCVLYANRLGEDHLVGTIWNHRVRYVQASWQSTLKGMKYLQSSEIKRLRNWCYWKTWQSLIFSALSNTFAGSTCPSMLHLILLSFDEIKEKDLENNSINDGNAR